MLIYMKFGQGSWDRKIGISEPDAEQVLWFSLLLGLLGFLGAKFQTKAIQYATESHMSMYVQLLPYSMLFPRAWFVSYLLHTLLTQSISHPDEP